MEEFFGCLARLLKANPPKPEDAPIIAQMAEIGIVPGQEFDHGKLPFLGHRLDPKLALLELVRAMKDKKPVNGWLYWTSDAGQYGTDYEQRAMVTMIGPGLNFPQDALYPFSEKDADGKEYDGSKHGYIMRFEKGQMPPVKGFWSLTMYDPDFFFIPNALNRYSLSQRDTFAANADGSVTCTQADSPGPGKEANWLPAPGASSSRCSASTGRRTRRPRSWMDRGPAATKTRTMTGLWLLPSAWARRPTSMASRS